MSNNNIKDEQMETHIKTRNKILSELQQAYKNNSYHQSSHIDSSTCNVQEINEEICSPVVDDLLMEMNGRRLRNLEKNNDTDCYRCKHFLNVPPNFFDIYERISDCAEEYEADLNFVQAIVWLKSATTSMKDVSVKQFHLIFHKQWNNNRNTRKDSEHQKSVSQEHDCESLNLTIHLDNTQENNVSFDSNSEYINSTDLLCNVQLREKHDLSQSGHRPKEGNEILTENINSPFIFDSTQSLERSFSTQSCVQNHPILNKCIIPDSDETCSSSTDMFNDSSDNEDNDNSKWNRKDEKLLQENDLITDNLIEEFLSTSQTNNLLQNIVLETKHDLPVTSNEHDSLSVSDIILFDEECSLQSQNSNLLHKCNRRCVSDTFEQINKKRMSDSNLHNKNSSVSSNRIDDKDSDYDTHQLSSEYASRSNCILQNENINVSSDLKSDIITPYHKDSAYDTYDLEILPTSMISDEDRLFSLSSHHRSDESINQIGIDCNINREASSSSEDEHLQTEADKIKNKADKSKKRKLETVYDIEKEISQTKKKFLKTIAKEEKISSKWLRFTLDTLNADDVAFRSVKIILSVLQNDRMARRYMMKKCWKNTLEEQAVIAILNFCDVFEAERKTAACTQEIVQAVINTLDKSIENTELNKVTLFTHRVSIILELCNSAKICIETINHLTTKLKSYESILIALMNGKKADVHNIINQLHIIFYALNVCLQKYRLMFPNEQHSQFEEETVPSVVDLWKKQLIFEDVMIEDSLKTRERRWLIILDDFMVVSVENCSQFAEKLRTLIDLITRE